MKRAVILAVVATCQASLALSAEISIGGNYGNDQGCAFARNPDNFIGGAYMLLTPSQWKTPQAGCDFTDASPPWEKYGNRLFTVTAVCAGEGTDVSRTELLRIEKSLEVDDTYIVYDAAGMEIGRGARCP